MNSIEINLTKQALEDYAAAVTHLSPEPPFYAGVVLSTISIKHETLPLQIAQGVSFDRATPHEYKCVRSFVTYMGAVHPSTKTLVGSQWNRSLDYFYSAVTAVLASKGQAPQHEHQAYVVRCADYDACEELGLIDQLSIYPMGINILTLHVTVQPLCCELDRIACEGPKQNLQHSMALFA